MTEADKLDAKTTEEATEEVTEETVETSTVTSTVTQSEQSSKEEALKDEPAEEDDAPQDSTAAQGASTSGAHGAHAAPVPKKKRAGLIVGIIIAIVVVLCAAIAFVPTILANIGRSQLAVEWPEDVKVVTYEGVTYEYDPNVVTVCVIGNDRARHIPTEEFNGQADAVIVAAVNTETGEVSCLSIPRNTMVEGWTSFEANPDERSTQEEQLCLVYSHGTSDEFSSENICHSVSSILEVPIKNYFTVNEEVIGALADAVGGVPLVPTVTIPNTLIVEGEEILMTGPKLHEFEAPTVYGGTAMDYTIWRDKSEEDSSVHRGERQLQYLKAFIPHTVEKIKADPALLLELYDIVMEYATTNLDVSEFVSLASALTGRSDFELNMVALPGETVLDHIEGDIYWEEVYLDEDAVKQIVLDVFYDPVP